MISFEPMRKLMEEKGITQYQLLKDGVLLPAHVTRLSYNHNFTLKFIDKLYKSSSVMCLIGIPVSFA